MTSPTKLLLVSVFFFFLFNRFALCAEVSLLANADEATQTRTNLIRNAKKQIITSSYIAGNDALMAHYATELIQAAQKGVEVYFLVDGLGSYLGNWDLFQYMQDQGIKVKVMNPSPLSRAFFFRMHDKVIVADNELTLIGGRNYWLPSFGLGKYAHLDMEIQVKDMALAENVSAYFFKRWEQAKDINRPLTVKRKEKVLNFLQNAKKLPETEGFNSKILSNEVSPPITVETDKVRFIFDNAFIGEQDKNSIDHILELIDSAQRSIMIESPWVVLTSRVREALQRARKRAVKITILTNSKNSSERKSRFHVTRAGSRWFTEQEGIEVYEQNSTSLHSKYLVIDEERAYVGTFNLGPRSERLNSETGVIFESTQLAQQLAKTFKERLTQAELMAPFRYFFDSICPGIFYRILGTQF